MGNDLPWRRILAEGLAIVMSILLAFGIQAWWDSRNDRIDEARVLAALHAELQENIQIVRGSIDSHERSRRMAQQLLDISLGISDLPRGAEEVVSLVGESFLQYRTTNLALGTVTAVLTSGEIGLIRNFEIRRGIASLQGTVEDALEDEAVLLEIRNQFLMPFQVERIPAMGRNPPRRAEPLPTELGAEVVAAQVVDVLGDDQLEAWLGQSLQHRGSTVASLQRLEATLVELWGLIDTEITSEL